MSRVVRKVQKDLILELFCRYSSHRGVAAKSSRKSTVKWWRTYSSWRWTTSRTSSSSRGPSSPRPETPASANVRWPPRLRSASSGCSTGCLFNNNLTTTVTSKISYLILNIREMVYLILLFAYCTCFNVDDVLVADIFALTSETPTPTKSCPSTRRRWLNWRRWLKLFSANDCHSKTNVSIGKDAPYAKKTWTKTTKLASLLVRNL